MSLDTINQCGQLVVIITYSYNFSLIALILGKRLVTNHWNIPTIVYSNLQNDP